MGSVRRTQSAQQVAAGTEECPSPEDILAADAVAQPGKTVGDLVGDTYALIKEGKSVKEVAAKRNLAVSTIEGHVVKGISEGALDIYSVMQEKRVKEVADLLRESSDSVGEIHRLQNGKFSHGVLRMVQAHLKKTSL